MTSRLGTGKPETVFYIVGEYKWYWYHEAGLGAAGDKIAVVRQPGEPVLEGGKGAAVRPSPFVVIAAAASNAVVIAVASDAVIAAVSDAAIAVLGETTVAAHPKGLALQRKKNTYTDIGEEYTLRYIKLNCYRGVKVLLPGWVIRKGKILVSRSLIYRPQRGW